MPPAHGGNMCMPVQEVKRFELFPVGGGRFLSGEGQKVKFNKVMILLAGRKT